MPPGLTLLENKIRFRTRRAYRFSPFTEVEVLTDDLRDRRREPSARYVPQQFDGPALGDESRIVSIENRLHGWRQRTRRNQDEDKPKAGLTGEITTALKFVTNLIDILVARIDLVLDQNHRVGGAEGEIGESPHPAAMRSDLDLSVDTVSASGNDAEFIEERSQKCIACSMIGLGRAEPAQHAGVKDFVIHAEHVEDVHRICLAACVSASGGTGVGVLICRSKRDVGYGDPPVDPTPGVELVVEDASPRLT